MTALRMHGIDSGSGDMEVAGREVQVGWGRRSISGRTPHLFRCGYVYSKELVDGVLLSTLPQFNKLPLQYTSCIYISISADDQQ